MVALKKLVDIDDNKQQIDLELIANNLKRAMAEKNISASLLSDYTGLSVSAINNLKRAEGNPTIGTLASLANFFNVPLTQFLGIQGHIDHNFMTAINLFDLRFAHSQTDTNLLRNLLIEKPKNVNTDSIYAVIVNNNSLLPLYGKGTIFVISKNQPVLDGDMVLVRLHNSINALKRLFIKNKKLYLKNINIDNITDNYKESEIEFLGVVIQIIQETF